MSVAIYLYKLLHNYDNINKTNMMISQVCLSQFTKTLSRVKTYLFSDLLIRTCFNSFALRPSYNGLY